MLLLLKVLFKCVCHIQCLKIENVTHVSLSALVCAEARLINVAPP